MEMFNYIVTLQIFDSFRGYVFLTFNILTIVLMFLHLLSHLVAVDRQVLSGAEGDREKLRFERTMAARSCGSDLI